MSRVVVCTNLTLDGVMQSPGRPDEDTRGGFTHGGWGAPYAAMPEAGEYFGSAGALLLGRRTYEDFYNVWPARNDGRFTPWLTNTQKYVASTTLAEQLPWANSTLLRGDARDAVAKLRAQPGKDLLVLGSGALVRSLMSRQLVDLYVLLIHPIVLGSGARLFAEGVRGDTLRLVGTKTTATGVIIATYEPVERDTSSTP
jgi:Dihydrofolate reductase